MSLIGRLRARGSCVVSAARSGGSSGWRSVCLMAEAVRKHLEHVFGILGVQSRTAALSKLHAFSEKDVHALSTVRRSRQRPCRAGLGGLARTRPIGVLQHTEEHRPKRSVLLAVDRAEGSAIQIAVRSVRSREVFRPLGSRQLSSHVRARKR